MYSNVRTLPEQVLAAGSVIVAAVDPGLVVMKDGEVFIRVTVAFWAVIPPKAASMLTLPTVAVSTVVPEPFTSWRMLGILLVASVTVTGVLGLTGPHWALHAGPELNNA